MTRASTRRLRAFKKLAKRALLIRFVLGRGGESLGVLPLIDDEQGSNQEAVVFGHSDLSI